MTNRRRMQLVIMLLACSVLTGCVRSRMLLNDWVANPATKIASNAPPPANPRRDADSETALIAQELTPVLDLPAPQLPPQPATIEPLTAPQVRPAPDSTLIRLPDTFAPPGTPPAKQGADAPRSPDAQKAPSTDPSVPPPPTGVPVTSFSAKDEPLVEALRAILANRHEVAVQHLKAYGENEEVFLRMLPVLAMMARKPLPDISPEESAALNEQLERLAEILRPRTELVIKKMCCCEWVKSYGVYKPLPSDHVFLAASRTCPGELVQIYAEIGNISSKKHEGGHVTQLSTSVEIHDRKGNQGYYRRFGGAQPVQTLTPLRDYYNTYSFYVPQNMPPGVYTLTIHVTDETFPDRRRLASKSIEFRVSGLPNLPSN